MIYSYGDLFHNVYLFLCNSYFVVLNLCFTLEVYLYMQCPQHSLKPSQCTLFCVLCVYVMAWMLTHLCVTLFTGKPDTVTFCSCSG